MAHANQKGHELVGIAGNSPHSDLASSGSSAAGQQVGGRQPPNRLLKSSDCRRQLSFTGSERMACRLRCGPWGL